MSYQMYELLKAQWIANNPNSTPQQYQKAMYELAKKCGV